MTYMYSESGETKCASKASILATEQQQKVSIYNDCMKEYNDSQAVIIWFTIGIVVGAFIIAWRLVKYE